MRNNATASLATSMQKMGVNESVAAKSNLNPYAAEFVPGKNFTRPADTPALVHHTNGDKKSS
ncbi:putative Ataxin-2 C-terminal region-containing protein [Homarus americanus]|uniref:Putative Ataxin-2 C-terminal region-containing protein n=2 Tax=Homarus americanus TaxID=6706 RepID=A0A8J5MLE4_HOMAM|nr:putative Ataxin-2 C-terminal region-containing protein [Homarus americanus]